MLYLLAGVGRLMIYLKRHLYLEPTSFMSYVNNKMVGHSGGYLLYYVVYLKGNV